MALLGFTLPPDSGEKLSLGKSIETGRGLKAGRTHETISKDLNSLQIYSHSKNSWQPDSRLNSSINEYEFSLT